MYVFTHSHYFDVTQGQFLSGVQSLEFSFLSARLVALTKATLQFVVCITNPSPNYSPCVLYQDSSPVKATTSWKGYLTVKSILNLTLLSCSFIPT